MPSGQMCRPVQHKFQIQSGKTIIVNFLNVSLQPFSLDSDWMTWHSNKERKWGAETTMPCCSLHFKWNWQQAALNFDCSNITDCLKCILCWNSWSWKNWKGKLWAVLVQLFLSWLNMFIWNGISFMTNKSPQVSLSWHHQGGERFRWIIQVSFNLKQMTLLLFLSMKMLCLSWTELLTFVSWVLKKFNDSQEFWHSQGHSASVCQHLKISRVLNAHISMFLPHSHNWWPDDSAQLRQMTKMSFVSEHVQKICLLCQTNWKNSTCFCHFTWKDWKQLFWLWCWCVLCCQNLWHQIHCLLMWSHEGLNSVSHLRTDQELFLLQPASWEDVGLCPEFGSNFDQSWLVSFQMSPQLHMSLTPAMSQFCWVLHWWIDCESKMLNSQQRANCIVLVCQWQCNWDCNKQWHPTCTSAPHESILQRVVSIDTLRLE